MYFSFMYLATRRAYSLLGNKSLYFIMISVCPRYNRQVLRKDSRNVAKPMVKCHPPQIFKMKLLNED